MDTEHRRNALLLTAAVLGSVFVLGYSQPPEHAPRSGLRQSQSVPRPLPSSNPSLPVISTPRIALEYGRTPLFFEPNCGQVPAGVDFVARGPGYAIFLSGSEALLSLHEARPSDVSVNEAQRWQASFLDARRPNLPGTLLRLRLQGAEPTPAVKGGQRLASHSNYFLGLDPARWHSDIPHYGRVEYHNVYPGIDLVYYGNQTQLEYDFVVAPGADPQRIALNFEGAGALALAADGSLQVRLPGGQVLCQHAPLVYQEIEGQRCELTGSYRLLGENTVGFELGDYDRALPLVIDPIMTYSTYLGGAGSETARAVASDAAGNAYVVGDSTALDFPLSGSVQAANAGGADIFVVKFNPAGGLLYSTYLGGAGNEIGFGVAIDSAGNAYVTGQTLSTNFPVVAALQASAAGEGDAFVFKLNATGNALLYSSYLGGSAEEVGSSLVVDAAGGVVVAGSTRSSNFPVLGAAQTLYGGAMDGFVARLNAAGSALLYATFLGGSAADAIYGLALDAGGNVYAAGGTASTNFPVLNAYQPARNGLIGDAFLTKYSATGALAFSTYLGGSAEDSAAGVGVDSSGNIYVAGYTSSANFPTLNPVQPALSNSVVNAFAAKFNPAGNALLYSTYYGGNDQDTAVGIAVDAAGYIYVTGRTRSRVFPLVNATQRVHGGGLTDAFLFKLDPSGTQIQYSTFLGGNDQDDICSVAVDNENDAFLSGGTFSTNFPVVNAFQATPAQGRNAFVTKIDTTVPPLITSALTANALINTPFSYALTVTGSQPMSVVVSNLPPGLSYAGLVISGTPTAAGQADILITASNKGGSDVKALVLTIERQPGQTNTAPAISSPPVVSSNPATVGQAVTFSAAGSDPDGDVLSYRWDFGDGTTGNGPDPSHTYSASGVYTVTVTVSDGLQSVSSSLVLVVTGGDSTQNGSFAITKLLLKFNFASPNNDSLTVAGTFPVPEKFTADGRKITLIMDSFRTEFTLSKKASAKSGSNAIKFSGKQKKGVFSTSPLKFSISLKKQTLFSKLSSYGFTNDNIKKPPLSVSMLVVMGLDGSYFVNKPNVLYTCSKDKSGSGKVLVSSKKRK